MKRRIQRGLAITQSRDRFLGGNCTKGQFASVHENDVLLIEAAGHRKFETVNGGIDKSAGIPSHGRSFSKQRPAFQRLADGQSFLIQQRWKTPFPDVPEDRRVKPETEL